MNYEEAWKRRSSEAFWLVIDLANILWAVSLMAFSLYERAVYSLYFFVALIVFAIFAIDLCVAALPNLLRPQSQIEKTEHQRPELVEQHQKKRVEQADTIRFGVRTVKKKEFLAAFTFVFGFLFLAVYLAIIYGLAQLGLASFRSLNNFIWNDQVASSNLFMLILLIGFITALLVGLLIWSKRDFFDRLYFKIVFHAG